jgi:hypothetical protein
MNIFPNQQIAEFLGTIIFENSWVYLDLWSFIHLISGILITFWILNSVVKEKNDYISAFIVLVSLLLAYEFFEVFFYFSFFAYETSLNIVWDIFIGLIGGMLLMLYYYIFEK